MIGTNLNTGTTYGGRSNTIDTIGLSNILVIFNVKVFFIEISKIAV
jgi:hypothetical protein